jgi:hypothetical protein
MRNSVVPLDLPTGLYIAVAEGLEALRFVVW